MYSSAINSMIGLSFIFQLSDQTNLGSLCVFCLRLSCPTDDASYPIQQGSLLSNWTLSETLFPSLREPQLAPLYSYIFLNYISRRLIINASLFMSLCRPKYVLCRLYVHKTAEYRPTVIPTAHAATFSVDWAASFLFFWSFLFTVETRKTRMNGFYMGNSVSRLRQPDGYNEAKRRFHNVVTTYQPLLKVSSAHWKLFRVSSQHFTEKSNSQVK